MINDGAKIEKRNYELQCEKWFKEHGYTVRYLRQYSMTTKFELSKDGETYPVTINVEYLDKGVDHYLQNIERNHQMRLQIRDMKKQLEEREA